MANSLQLVDAGMLLICIKINKRSHFTNSKENNYQCSWWKREIMPGFILKIKRDKFLWKRWKLQRNTDLVY